MEKNKIDLLLEKKIDIDKNKEKVYEMYIPSLGMNVKYKRATRVEAVRMQQMDAEDVDSYAVYSHVVDPDLSDARLQEAYNNGKQPFMIVDELIPDMQEVLLLASAIAGNKPKPITKEIKN